MANSKGSSDESIGRPQEWREGRYQESGRSVDDSVKPGQESADRAAEQGTPVTLEDYGAPKPSPAAS